MAMAIELYDSMRVTWGYLLILHPLVNMLTG